MARADRDIEDQSADRLIMAIKEYAGDAENIVNHVLHAEAGPMINDEIIRILPVSGRKWKGKKRAASRAHPFLQDDGNLSVTVRTKNAYHYLYFPDDGSTTLHHYGGQRFMRRGAEHEQPKIIDRIMGSLVENFEEGVQT